ncbi:hypothetical protein [Bifidobacterium pseudolongum]|uniref:hypothetical protein n=1 Tax=Bifidobacterium pseudolongum TaxID=1694 RepID=UPI0011807C67|nr:hypothetical protein [Bifidobacterium pseudolongum]
MAVDGRLRWFQWCRQLPFEMRKWDGQQKEKETIMLMDRNTPIAVDDLQLWTANPRIDPVDTQLEAFREIYLQSGVNPEASRRAFRNLMDSISSKGFENEAEPVLVQKTGMGFEVRDGNRRVSALKCLLHPQAYREVLDADDYSFVLGCREAHPEYIADSIVVTMYGDSREESATLDDLLVRKHNGPQDGAGTVQWSHKAKQRFNEAHGAPEDFSSQLEAPFDEAFGQTLTSYLGGTKSRSTTKRLFSSKVAKNYLDIEDPAHPTSDELEKTKELADELKDMADERHLVLSRLNSGDLKEAIERMSDAHSAQPDITDSQTVGDALEGSKDEEFRIPRHSSLFKQLRYLGGKWNFNDYRIDDPEFDSLNLMLSGLADRGLITNDNDKCLRRMAILAPSCRVFFELASSIVERQPSFHERAAPVEKGGTLSLKERVGRIQQLIREDRFITFLSSKGVLSTSYNSCKKVIANTDFAAEADMSNETSHGSIANVQIETIKNMFNNAVLFSYICEHLVKYMTPDTQGK